MICFDANVLIEVILERKNAAVCRQYMQTANEDMAITMLSLDLVMYYAEKHKLDLSSTEQFVRLFLWLPIAEDDAESAFRLYAGDDYEDALQVSCAQREGCTSFVTLDRGLAKKYSAKLQVDLLP
jgi:predicted nucleic acid-binding protein